MTTRPSEQARKRYYLVSLDLSLESGANLFFENKQEALVNGLRTAGTHEHRVPGSPHPEFVGVPPLLEKPKLVLVGDDEALDYYGPMPVFVSSRAKRLIEGIDPHGFEFAECDTVTESGEPVEPYWCMDVIRWVEKFDEAQSEFERYRDRFPADPDAQSSPRMFRLYDIRMPEGFPEDHHAFWLAHFRNYPVFDEVLVDAWRDAGLTGLRFTPLQAPTDAEFEDHLSFVNYPYWTEKARRT